MFAIKKTELLRKWGISPSTILFDRVLIDFFNYSRGSKTGVCIPTRAFIAVGHEPRERYELLE